MLYLMLSDLLWIANEPYTLTALPVFQEQGAYLLTVNC